MAKKRPFATSLSMLLMLQMCLVMFKVIASTSVLIQCFLVEGNIFEIWSKKTKKQPYHEQKAPIFNLPRVLRSNNVMYAMEDSISFRLIRRPF